MVSISNEQKIEKDGKKRGRREEEKDQGLQKLQKNKVVIYSQDDRKRDISQKRVGLWVGGKRPHTCTATYAHMSPSHVIY